VSDAAHESSHGVRNGESARRSMCATRGASIACVLCRSYIRVRALITARASRDCDPITRTRVLSGSNATRVHQVDVIGSSDGRFRRPHPHRPSHGRRARPSSRISVFRDRRRRAQRQGARDAGARYREERGRRIRRRSLRSQSQPERVDTRTARVRCRGQRDVRIRRPHTRERRVGLRREPRPHAR